MLNKALGVQDVLDAWISPPGVESIQIAGWGATTLSGITYTEKDNSGCLGYNNCPLKLLDYKPELVVDGDGTVVLPSAFAMGTGIVKSYYVNLEKYNEDHFINRKHESILEVPFLEELISNIIKGKSELPQYITTEEPLSTGARLSFVIHSPVFLDLYDSFGRHTGVATTTHSGGDIQLVDEQIPNSYYMEFGEGKYASAGGASTITVKLLGQSLGVFTFDVKEADGNTIIASTTFAGIPVTANTTAVMDIFNLSASSTPILRMDVDGDGTIDFSITPQSASSPLMSVEILRRVVMTLGLPKGIEQGVVSKIDAAVDALNRGNTKTALNQVNALVNYIKAQTEKHIPLDEADELINILEKIKRKMVK